MTTAGAQDRLKKPLQLAAEHKLWEVCSILLRDAEEDSYYTENSIALYYAAEAGQVELVQQLLDRGGWAERPWTEPVGDDELEFWEQGKACVVTPHHGVSMLPPPSIRNINRSHTSGAATAFTLS
jgi:hypothetical protein